MMTQLEQRYGADNSIYDVKELAKLDYSSFDFSRKHNTTFDIGQYVPFDWFLTIPGDKISLNVRYLLDTLPLVNPPYTNYRVRVHWNVIKMSALWKGWNSFVSQGRKGEVSVKEIPFFSKDDFEGYRLPSSLASYLGLPVCEYCKTLGFKYYKPNAEENDEIALIPNRSFPINGVSALPFMAYQKIWRFDVCPQNLLQDNEIWFPEDLSEEWRINYLGTNLKKGIFTPQDTLTPNADGSAYTEDIVAHNVPSVEDNAVDIRQLRYATFDHDYFTTAKPWLVRGNSLPHIDFESFINFEDVFSDFYEGPGSTENWALGANLVSDTSNPVQIRLTTPQGQPFSSLSSEQKSSVVNALVAQYNKAKLVSASMTANNLRSMLAFSVWQERNALTNGEYNEFIRAHFDIKPNQPDYQPYYLGGLSDMVSFAQILQTSASQEGSPMGTNASIGSTNGQGHCFTYKSNDFALVMGTIFVTPEVYYEQGVGHEWTDRVPEDIFMPE
ncbi:MAG: major capsid protein, partial [Candidatus Bathyarchaeota archaeon]|nr:major capsid protein [Candidatus Bathyarchaeota archaeon]